MGKRKISLLLALLLAFQPTAAMAAENEANSVVKGDGYTIRTQFDGTKTLTFTADLAEFDYVGSAADVEEETENGN